MQQEKAIGLYTWTPSEECCRGTSHMITATTLATCLFTWFTEMLLPDTHPEAQSMLENGDLGVQRTTKHGFTQLPVDQTID